MLAHGYTDVYPFESQPPFRYAASDSMRHHEEEPGANEKDVNASRTLLLCNRSYIRTAF